MSAKRLNAEQCDDAKHQYGQFLVQINKYHRDECKTFSPGSQRLNTFLGGLLFGKNEYEVRWDVVKMVLTLSHGQSEVGRGFSVNEDILSCNMGPDTI